MFVVEINSVSKRLTGLPICPLIPAKILRRPIFKTASGADSITTKIRKSSCRPDAQLRFQAPAIPTRITESGV